MLTNASILRIDRRDGASAKGQPRFTAGPSIAADVLPCFLDEISTSQQLALGENLKDASEICYVEVAAVAAAGEAAPAAGDRMNIDGVTQELLQVKPRLLNDISHFELLLKDL